MAKLKRRKLNWVSEDKNNTIAIAPPLMAGPCQGKKSAMNEPAKEAYKLNMAKAEKVDNIACWVKNLEADVAAFEAQEKAFADRKAAAKRKIDSLKHYLTDALGGQNFSSDRCAVSFRRSKAVCVLDEFRAGLLGRITLEAPGGGAVDEG